jgi:Flp pilus assembly protein TadG
MKWMRHGQRGQAIVIVALMLVVMFGILGLALDSGRAYLDKRDLQASVDAAALTAAYKYMNTPDYTQAEQAASNSYASNARLYDSPSCAGFGSLSATCTFTSLAGDVLSIVAADHSIAGVSFTVTATHSIPVAIMQVLGSGPTISITATATAVARHAGTNPAGIHTLSPNGCGGNGGFSLRITGTESTTMIGDVWSNGNIVQNGSATAAVTGNVVDVCPPIPPSINGITLTPGSGSEANGWAIPDPDLPAPPLNPTSQTWGQSDNNVVRVPGTYSSNPQLTGQAGCFFLAGGVYQWRAGITINGGFTSNELRPPDEPSVTATTAALSGTISSVPVVALTATVPVSTTVMVSGQAFRTTTVAAIGATSIAVQSHAVSGVIPSGSTVTTTARSANQFWDANGVGCSGYFQPYHQGSDSGNSQIPPSTYGIELTAIRWEAYGVPSCNGPASPTCFLRESAPSMCKLVDVANNQFLRVWTTNVPGAMAYRVYLSNGSCDGPFGYLGQINNSVVEGNRTVSGCPQTFTPSQPPSSLSRCDLGASGPQNFNGSNFSPDFTIHPPDGEAPPVGPSPLPNSDPGPLTAAPPAGDQANENLCADLTATRVACPPTVSPGYVTPGAVIFFVPGGGSCNPGALNMNGGGDVYLFSGQQYRHILLYEPGPEQTPPPNTCSNSIGGHGITSLLGIFYMPAADVTITGSSGYLSTIAGGVIAWTVTINGNGSVAITGDPNLGTWPPAVHLTQ